VSELDHIQVVGFEEQGGLRENVRAILHEIETMLEALLASNETGAIDIRSLPLLPGDYEALEVALGTGEIVAEFDGGFGNTMVSETGTSGVWWIKHYSEEGNISAEFIETTRIPEILMTPEDDMRDSLKELHERLHFKHSH
jgi:hydrogenase-1 operon protein HyaF